MGRGTGTGPTTNVEEVKAQQLSLDLERIEVELPGGLSMYPDPDLSQWAQDMRDKRKREGRCLHCGDLLPMSAMGLGDCTVCIG